MSKLVLFSLILLSCGIFFQLDSSFAQSSEKLTVNNIRIGHPITILLFDSNLNLDSKKSESYSLDLILFESKNVKTTLGPNGAQKEINPRPSVLRETGDDTGIFYSVIEIPSTLKGKRISGGEKISFEYVQRGYGAFLQIQDGAIFDKTPTPEVLANQNSTKPGVTAKKEVIINQECKNNFVQVTKALDGSKVCVKPQTKVKLIERGWANSDLPKTIEPLNVIVKGNQQVRIGTTHTIEVQVMRGDTPVSGARVFIDIEDYGENVIKSFKGYTNSAGNFIFSWEIPKSFNDVKTLLAFIGVTDDISAKTILFKFQIYCLPGESGCQARGN